MHLPECHLERQSDKGKNAVEQPSGRKHLACVYYSYPGASGPGKGL